MLATVTAGSTISSSREASDRTVTASSDTKRCTGSPDSIRRSRTRGSSTGPAAATWNSALALGGSSDISATPPNRNSVIPFIGRPWRRATSEWDSSWSTTEANSPRAPAAPMIQQVVVSSPECGPGNQLSASDQVNSSRTTNQLGSSRTEEPNRSKRWMRSPNTVPPQSSL